MSMNGIDISSWQKGINLNAVPCDFVIVKATGGTEYINPDYNRAMNQAISAGKKVGVYHYAREKGCKGSAAAEADFFVKTVQSYIGKAILVLDWGRGASSWCCLGKRIFRQGISENRCESISDTSVSVTKRVRLDICGTGRIPTVDGAISKCKTTERISGQTMDRRKRLWSI